MRQGLQVLKRQVLNIGQIYKVGDLPSAILTRHSTGVFSAGSDTGLKGVKEVNEVKEVKVLRVKN